ncbi:MULTISPECIES: hypothetical protein [Chryseobacterium]|uniref:KilA-N DNA-binding domain-containing protein n=1 Tax=Chryseobacterium camelliae TaxID=1265445 RepID=A0ABU0TDN7_9FLAO|nr:MULTISPECIES: hypothetical protein [Chryseobacterium]MDT3407020.1 hypothetical protein [Pseudacidovorax intermedius]MDQ1095189.1 hypothetical protein [Chryseobacterium camelliae]MDQ1099126.1 hypothetical protein [Chryseobacterium sp. SORGH_AS_1048]MDR6086475.1 hypothetical protein [Chryseobacterium sp. SORGH_AS_0909]MDR6130847.1 hypothetical protein [Chryseobacterium sp. SORGH_AS_1175]
MSIDKKLREQRVRHTIIDGEEYFYVEDIRNNQNFLITDLSQVIYQGATALIKAKFVHELTLFDKLMKQTLNIKQDKEKED